jgi:hypothetical protein
MVTGVAVPLTVGSTTEFRAVIRPEASSSVRAWSVTGAATVAAAWTAVCKSRLMLVSVTAAPRTTCSATLPLLLELKLIWSPLNWAVISCVATPPVVLPKLVFSTAEPPEATGTVPTAVPLSKKVTEPLGVPEAVTVAVNFTGWPLSTTVDERLGVLMAVSTGATLIGPVEPTATGVANADVSP